MARNRQRAKERQAERRAARRAERGQPLPPGEDLEEEVDLEVGAPPEDMGRSDRTPSRVAAQRRSGNGHACATGSQRVCFPRAGLATMVALHAGRVAMIKVSVMYPNKPGARFDQNYRVFAHFVNAEDDARHAGHRVVGVTCRP